MSSSKVTPNRNILVIDDNAAIHADFRKVLGRPEATSVELDAFEAEIFGGLESVWFDIDAASQGEEGLSKVRQSIAENRPYALAFVDVRMPPGWDGIETTRRLWEVDPNLQVVICTAHSDYSWEQMQEELTPGDRLLILKKPFDAIEVQQLANALTEKWRLTKEAANQQRAERMAQQEKVREQASLLNNARDAILVFDLSHHITYWNKGAQVLYGWTEAEIQGCSFRELLCADQARYDTAYERVLREGEWTDEIRQVTKDGRDLLVESRWTLVRHADGGAKAVMAINTDITEKKKMEAHLLRSQRIESIGTLAGGIAHDLNNVLLPIMLSIDLLKLTVHDQGQLGILSTIEGSAKRGADMVQQVLTFARGVDCERHRIEPGSVIQEIRHFIRETFPKNIECVIDAPGKLPGFIGDATQVHQVLLNLCLNARDAMAQGGRLSVTTTEIILDVGSARLQPQSKPGRYIAFQVTDTGTGISDDLAKKIFDPFFTTKELGKGTGLGLSTVMAIVKSHGGFINLETQVGVGTSFTVHFPVEASEETAAAPVAAVSGDHPQGGGKLVLLVDDEESVRSITSQTLEAYGYRVLTARNGSDAVALYAVYQDQIEIVLTDMMMPVLDGPATIQKLKSMNPHVKIVAASGLDTGEAKAAAAGADLFLRKPFAAPVMLQALSHILR